MSRLRFTKIVTPNPVPTGSVELYDSSDTPGLLRTIDELNNLVTLTPVFNYSVTSQLLPVARTYLTGSTLSVPITKLKIGSTFQWRFNITKDANGSASGVVDIAIGTAGAVGDTAVVSFTKPAGTNVADEGFIEIIATVRGPLTASCIITAEMVLYHNLATTGHAQVSPVVLNTVSGAFDATVALLKLGICVTGGASDNVTVQQVLAAAVNL
jgi:hypothetical protein